MKKWMVIALTLIVTFGMVPVSLGTAVPYGQELVNSGDTYTPMSFSDVPDSYWAYQYISAVAARHIMTGYPDGKFRPDRIITRAEFAALLVKGFGLPVQKANYSSFSDIKPTDWESPWAEATKDYLNSYVVGGRLMFKPKMTISREDVAKALVKARGYDIRLADCSTIEAMFTDYDGISQASRPYVALAIENGLMSGYPDDTFRAQALLTRAQLASLIWRAAQYGADNQVEGTTVTNSSNGTSATITTPADTTSTNNTRDTSSDDTSASNGGRVETLANVGGIGCMTCDSDNNIYYINQYGGNIDTIFRMADNDSSVWLKTGSAFATQVGDHTIDGSDIELACVRYNPGDGNIYILAHTMSYTMLYAASPDGTVNCVGYVNAGGSGGGAGRSWITFGSKEILVKDVETYGASYHDVVAKFANGNGKIVANRTGFMCGSNCDGSYYALGDGEDLYKFSDNLLDTSLVKSFKDIDAAIDKGGLFYCAKGEAIWTLTPDGTARLYYSFAGDRRFNSKAYAMSFDNSGRLLVYTPGNILRID